MDTQDLKPEPASTHAEAKSLETRRKLLKASLAAPLVAGLTPKSVLAANSIVTCRGGNFADFQLAGTNSDNAYRVIVHSWGKTDSPNSDRLFLLDKFKDPVGLLSGSSNNIKEKRKIQKFDDLYTRDGQLISINGNKQLRNALRNEYPHRSTAEVIVVFDMDSDGVMSPRGFYPAYEADGSNFALSQSCLTSVVMSKMVNDI